MARAPDGKIRNREPLANEPGLASERSVEHGRKAVEVLLTSRNEARIGGAEAEHSLGRFLVSDHPAGLGVPVRAFPREPAQDIRLTFQIGGPEPTGVLLRRQVKQNGVGFPKHKTVVLERRYFSVGVESEVLRRKLVAP